MPSCSIFVSIQLYPAVFVQADSEEFFAQPCMFHKRATLPSGCQYGYCIANSGDSQTLFILKLFWRLPEQPPAVKAYAGLQPWPRRRDLFPASTAAFIAVRLALSLKLCVATGKVPRCNDRCNDNAAWWLRCGSSYLVWFKPCQWILQKQTALGETA